MSPAGGRSEAKFVLTRSQEPFLFPQKKKWFLTLRREPQTPSGGTPDPQGQALALDRLTAIDLCILSVYETGVNRR